LIIKESVKYIGAGDRLAGDLCNIVFLIPVEGLNSEH